DRDIIDIIRADLSDRLRADSGQHDLYIDSIKAAGEDNSAKLIAAYFTSIGMQAEYVNPANGGLIVNDPPERAQALPESYGQLAALSGKPSITVFPGFFGYTESGMLRTFDRGGSDITGSILAAAVKAELYENFTDVD